MDFKWGHQGKRGPMLTSSSFRPTQSPVPCEGIWIRNQRFLLKTTSSKFPHAFCLLPWKFLLAMGASSCQGARTYILWIIIWRVEAKHEDEEQNLIHQPTFVGAPLECQVCLLHGRWTAARAQLLPDFEPSQNGEVHIVQNFWKAK